MKILRNTGIVLLVAVCLAVIGFFGFFLVRTFFPVTMEPQMLDTEVLFADTEPEPVQEIAEEEPVEELPEEPVEEAPAEDTGVYREKAQAYLQTMTMEQKLWQLFFTTPDDLTGVDGATEAGEMTKNALKEMPVGGLCYFAANLEDTQQVTALLTGTASYCETPAFLAVDEEGGIVSRLGANENISVDNIGPAADFGAISDALLVTQMAGQLAGQMKALGFNMDFAPVADLAMEGNTEIGTRAYSSDHNVVAELSGAMVRGLQENGIAACLKHFPGHGSTTTDSHEAKSVSTRTPEQLRAEEFPAFSRGIEEGVCFVMMSHLTNENLSPLPSSLSPETVGLLRNELGFEGVIITDSLKMGAVINEYTSAQAAVMAISAGCDMLLMPNDLATAYDGLVAAVLDGTLSQARIDESVLRILTAKYQMGIME